MCRRPPSDICPAFLPVTQQSREATDRALETVTANQTPLIRVAMLRHTCLLTLLSLTHSCPVVTRNREPLGLPPHLLYGPLLVSQAEARLLFSYSWCAEDKTKPQLVQLKGSNSGTGTLYTYTQYSPSICYTILVQKWGNILFPNDLRIKFLTMPS